MPTPTELTDKFWKALADDRTVMLGLHGVHEGHTRPMTALLDDGARGPIWFFTAKDHDLTRAMGQSDRAIGSYSGKGHDLFASLRGTLQIVNDRSTIDRLWNPVIAQWYEGKDDPKLALVRFDVEDAKIWLSTVRGFLKPALNKLLGRKPDAGAKQDVAEVGL